MSISMDISVLKIYEYIEYIDGYCMNISMNFINFTNILDISIDI